MACFLIKVHLLLKPFPPPILSLLTNTPLPRETQDPTFHFPPLKVRLRWALFLINFIPFIYKSSWDFPGGAVVKNLPASAGEMASIPGPGRSHIPWSS